MGVRLNTLYPYKRAYMRYQEHIIELIDSEMKRQNITAYALSQKTGISQATLSLLLGRDLDVLTVPLVYSILLALNVRIEESFVSEGYDKAIIEEQIHPVIGDAYLNYKFSNSERAELMEKGRIERVIELYKPTGVYKGIIYVHPISGLVSFCRTDVLKSKYGLNDDDALRIIDGQTLDITYNKMRGKLFLDFDSSKIKFVEKLPFE